MSGVLVIALIYYYVDRPPKLGDKLPPRRDLTKGPPPTPEESKKATNHLRVANAFYDEAYKQPTPEAQAAKFYQASKALMHAGALDPRTIFLGKDEKGEPYQETQDEMAAKFLYAESLTYLRRAEAATAAGAKWLKEWDGSGSILTNDMRVFEKKALQNAKEAVRPAERALAYQPNSIFYSAHMVRVYRHAGRHRDAAATLKKALELSPDDIELLKLDAP